MESVTVTHVSGKRAWVRKLHVSSLVMVAECLRGHASPSSSPKPLKIPGVSPQVSQVSQVFSAFYSPWVLPDVGRLRRDAGRIAGAAAAVLQPRRRGAGPGPWAAARASDGAVGGGSGAGRRCGGAR